VLPLVAAVTVPPVAAAQGGPRVGVSASGAEVLVRSVTPSATGSLRGIVLGGRGRFTWGRIFFRAGYDQGTLRPTTPGIGKRDFVEAFALLGTNPIAGLRVAVGPYARAYVTDSTTQRWIYWEVRLGYETALGAPWAHAYGSVWGIVAGTVNVAEAMTGGRGGTAGIRTLLGPLALDLSYAIDESRFGTSVRRETVQAIRLAVGMGVP